MIPDLAQEGKAQEQKWVPQPEAPVVMFNNVAKTYGRYQAIGGISLAISGGVTGILGLNGAGKSTLFKLLMGKLQPTKERFDCLVPILGKIQHHMHELAMFQKMRTCTIG